MSQQQDKYEKFGEVIGEAIASALADLFDHCSSFAKQVVTVPVIAAPVMLLWNYALPALTGASAITYLQSVAVVALLRLVTARPKIEVMPALTEAEIEMLSQGATDEEPHLRLVRSREDSNESHLF